MKFDRNPESQTQRIDRQKANRLQVVTELPNRGAEGDSVILVANEEATVGVPYIWSRKKWIRLGGAQDIGDVPDVPGAPSIIGGTPGVGGTQHQAPTTDLFHTVEAEGGQQIQVPFTYNAGRNPSGGEFRIEWFGSIPDLSDGTPALAADLAPTDVDFNPERPLQVEGTHIGIITFTPRSARSTLYGKIYIQ